MNNITNTLLKPQEVRQLLGISKSTLYRMVERQEIPYLRISSRLRFSRQQLADYLSGQRVPALGEQPTDVDVKVECVCKDMK